MPAGATTIGLIAFGAVKLAGYTAAAAYLRKALPENRPNIFLVGATRTLIGVAAGIAAVASIELLGDTRADLTFFALLIPVRLAEWLLLIRLFFAKPQWTWKRSLVLAALGILWSFLLDIPAIAAAFLVPGGMWIC
jgi:hypothetical protein